MKIPAPIDRPLSRAYLREFSGWSTEYPPGLSDPTSLRIMENILIGREGAALIRPGLRYISYSEMPALDTPGVPVGFQVVGSHETFFLNDGTKVYLFAVVEDDGTVGFRVMVPASLGCLVQRLTDGGLFNVPQGESTLAFSSDTTYVSYLQIDNKIFALSNAGESMRMFEVGVSKVARKLNAIQRPNWTVDDKLTVVHPEAAWIDDTLPDTLRTNYMANPGFEQSLNLWGKTDLTEWVRSDDVGHTGSWSAKITSKPDRTNLVPNPIRDASLYGYAGWDTGGLNVDSYDVYTTRMRAYIPAGDSGRFAQVRSPVIQVEAGKDYGISWAGGTFGTNIDFVAARVSFHDSSGTQIGALIDKNVTPDAGRYHINSVITAPSGAVTMRVRPRVQVNTTGARSFFVGQVLVTEPNGFGWVDYFDGNTVGDYYWTGATDASPSVYHPPKDIEIFSDPRGVGDGPNVTVSGYFRSTGAARNCVLGLIQYDAFDNELSSDYDTSTMDANGSWTRVDFTVAEEPDISTVSARFRITGVPRGEYHYIDSTMIEVDSVVGDYFDGDTADTPLTDNSWSGIPYWSHSTQLIVVSSAAIPTAETRTADTLISSTTADNDYNFGFFYAFANQVGETAGSQVTVVKAQRAWSAWLWETPNGAGEPSGVETTDPNACADQLVAVMPEAVFDQAVAEGAASWSMYLVTWSDQDPVPVTAVKVAEQTLSSTSLYESAGWARITPQQVGAFAQTVPLPNLGDRTNYTDPAKAGQGIVAADRMVLVLDPTEQALIRWSSNQQGDYTNFTANLGGGRKTLTSGNLFIPACVKLWQNPQSVDTLTILCMGTDGRSTGYYMAPAQVASQSEAVNIMGFEETTATPGTTSPFGCEVFNNALYHPLDDQLMKSTANNYNIAHKSQTEQLTREWSRLANKHRIVSCQLDGRLYFLVHNVYGEELEPGARGNEVWIFDAKAENGTWSRWLVQGVSLRTIERGGRIYMSICKPDGIYYFDPDYGLDDYVAGDEVLTRSIPWRLETNTQGANRAHDAWAHVQQVNVIVGNFAGSMRYGIRSWDINGFEVDLSTEIRDNNDTDAPVLERDLGLPYDMEDFLLIRKDLKEWLFFAESIEENDTVLPSAGQLNLVQYRYTPSTVNTGYEWGSVETFEYRRGGLALDLRTTHNGVPMPYIDTGRP